VAFPKYFLSIEVKANLPLMVTLTAEVDRSKLKQKENQREGTGTTPAGQSKM
jgi:hypothetical protein